MMKNNVLIVVQCRYKSTRLEGKALYPLTGIPMLVFLFRRLQTGLPENTYRIILATTEFPQDDVIAAWGLEEGVEVFRGDEDDVLKRYVRCLKRYPAATVVRVTADNPLTCPEIIKSCVNYMQKNKVDYVQSQNHPRGAGVDVFTFDLLKTMDRETMDPYEREHLNAFVLNHPERFKIHFLTVQGENARPDLSMTVDTKNDWGNVNAVFKPEDKEPWRISLREVIVRMDPSSCSK